MSNQNHISKPAPQRLYSLDLYRVILVLLGFVLHTMIMSKFMLLFLNPQKTVQMVIQGSSRSQLFSIVLSWIHLMRMPAFFLLAGFFAQFLYHKYGCWGLAKNRFKRIFVPLFAMLAWVNLPNLVSVVSIHFMAHSPRIASAYKVLPSFHFQNIAYLWFLMFLLVMETAFIMLAPLFKKLYTFEGKHLKYFILGIILISMSLLCLAPGWYFSVPFTTSFHLVVLYFAFYFCFFVVGTMLGCSHFLNQLRNVKAMLGLLLLSAIACVLYYAAMYYHGASVLIYATVLHVAIAWLVPLSLLMLCLLYANRRNAVIRYLSDASYFLYLAQLPTIIVLEMIFRDHTVPLLTFFIVMCLALVIDVLLYQLLVRRKTWLSYIDGGRRLKTPTAS